MIVGGLVSVTFRQLNVDKIIELVKKTDLSAIEWGGDIHVPHGDIQCAYDTRSKTNDAGLLISSYGSYYRVGHHEPLPYEKILDTALALGAPIIRVWAGKRNSEDADPAYWQQVVSDSQYIANLSASAGLKVAFEYHPNTLTNTLKSTLKLLDDIENTAVSSYWQTTTEASFDENIYALKSLRPWLSNIHLSTGRKPLNDPETPSSSFAWKTYLKEVASTKRDHYALIEFVKDDSPGQFLEDAATLNTWLHEIQ